LSKNPNITYAPTGRRVATQIVKENPHKPWNYDNLSRHPNITWEIVQANSESLRDAPQGHKPWDYYFLSQNPNITWQIVQANPDKPWDYDLLSKNTFNCRKYNWSKKLHKYYSKKIKREILHLIWIFKKMEHIKIIPKDILYMILSILY